MSPTPNLQDLIDSVSSEVAEDDLLAQLAKASEYASNLNQLGDRLLDHFVHECREAGMSWSELSGALGVSKQAAHKRFTGTSPTFERFTDRARMVTMAAKEMARKLGHPAVEPEHVLLALFAPEKSIAALALARLKVNRKEVVLKVTQQMPPVENASNLNDVQYSTRSRNLLQGTLAEALGFGHNYIGTEHLLLALHRDEASPAAQILTSLGADAETLRSTVTGLLAEYIQSVRTVVQD